MIRVFKRDSFMDFFTDIWLKISEWVPSLKEHWYSWATAALASVTFIEWKFSLFSSLIGKVTFNFNKTINKQTPKARAGDGGTALATSMIFNGPVTAGTIGPTVAPTVQVAEEQNLLNDSPTMEDTRAMMPDLILQHVAEEYRLSAVTSDTFTTNFREGRRYLSDGLLREARFCYVISLQGVERVFGVSPRYRRREAQDALLRLQEALEQLRECDEGEDRQLRLCISAVDRALGSLLMAVHS